MSYLQYNSELYLFLDLQDLKKKWLYLLIYQIICFEDRFCKFVAWKNIFGKKCLLSESNDHNVNFRGRTPAMHPPESAPGNTHKKKINKRK